MFKCTHCDGGDRSRQLFVSSQSVILQALCRNRFALRGCAICSQSREAAYVHSPAHARCFTDTALATVVESPWTTAEACRAQTTTCGAGLHRTGTAGWMMRS